MELAEELLQQPVITRQDIGKLLRSLGLDDVKVTRLKSPQYYAVVNSNGQILAKDPGCKGLLRKLIN